MLPVGDGDNINGPSLIRVPAWVSNALGCYYLYFAHHEGSYVRLAYADNVAGPWRVSSGGVLPLAEVPAVRGHIASPDAIIDHESKQIRLYFHGPSIQQKGPQRTFVALSRDGLTFEVLDEELGPFYFRVFEHRGSWFAVSKGGLLHRSTNGLSPFSPCHDLYRRAKPGPRGKYNQLGNIRHVAVQKAGESLTLYFTLIGDRPERILRAEVDLSLDWRFWSLGPVEEVMRPCFAYEGAGLPLKPSRSGAANDPENALRDPCIFVDDDGAVYLLYSVMGEKGIAVAKLRNPNGLKGAK
jgi:hypothetical protein